MPGRDEFMGIEPAWCPGCGNFGILSAFRDAMAEMGMRPDEFTIVSGIGQAAKFPHYVRCNVFNGLHGRALPAATGLRLANHEHTVMVFTGDGDCYGEGGNHFIHSIRRNVGIKLFVHDNQIYGLTKGQASPTSMEGIKTKNQPMGVISERMNPLALAVVLDCSFVARGFSGDPEHLKGLMIEAVRHRGFSLVDILQPCVSFNKVNTFSWYRERVYRLDDKYDPGDREAALKKALEWDDGIPIGVIYKNDRKLYEERLAVLEEGPLISRPFDRKRLELLKSSF